MVESKSIEPLLRKVDCIRGHGLSAAIKLGTPEPKFLQTDLKSVKQNLCLAPDQKMARKGCK